MDGSNTQKAEKGLDLSNDYLTHYTYLESTARTPGGRRGRGGRGGWEVDGGGHEVGRGGGGSRACVDDRLGGGRRTRTKRVRTRGRVTSYNLFMQYLVCFT